MLIISNDKESFTIYLNINKGKHKNSFMKFPHLLFLFISLITFIPSFSQIETSEDQSVKHYVENVLLGGGIEVANVKYIGKIGSLGEFESPKSILGLTKGIILSTGNIHKINGPNHAGNFTSKSSLPKDSKKIAQIRKGDKDLEKIVKEKVYDIAIVEFDFVPINNKLVFNYVFASEEYPEYVGSVYNDGFGFFLSGPDIPSKTNLAILPDGFTPVAINTINHLSKKRYFRQNFLEGFDKIKYGAKKTYYKELPASQKSKTKFEKSLMNRLQFDGLTRVLRVEYDVIPYQKYTIKIGIADAGDNVYDSAVLLEAGSFMSIVDEGGKYYSQLKKETGGAAKAKTVVNSNSKVAVKEAEKESFRIRNVWFDFDSYQLSDKSKNNLNNLISYLKENPLLNCHLKGFTDSYGSLEYNQKLSLNRALAVRKYLIEKGIDESRLRYAGLYFLNPVADNTTSSGRSQNRRVEISVE